MSGILIACLRRKRHCLLSTIAHSSTFSDVPSLYDACESNGGSHRISIVHVSASKIGCCT